MLPLLLLLLLSISSSHLYEYISTSSSSSYESTPLTFDVKERTIEVICRSTTLNSGACITITTINGVERYDSLGIGLTKQYQYGVSSESNNRNPINNNGILENDYLMYVHLVASFALNGNINIYKNGILYASHNIGSIITYTASNTKILFGKYNNSCTSNSNPCIYNGDISEARIYNGSLSSNDISKLYINYLDKSFKLMDYKGYANSFWLMNGNYFDTAIQNRYCINVGPGNPPVSARNRFNIDDSALYFDGTSYLQCNYGDYISLANKRNPRTITLWASLIPAPNSAQCFMGYSGYNNGDGFAIVGKDFKVGGWASTSEFIVSKSWVNYSYWNMHTLIYDGSNFIIFTNISSPTVVFAPNISTVSDGNIFFGNDQSGLSQFGPGYLDDAAYYNTALNSIQLTKLFNRISPITLWSLSFLTANKPYTSCSRFYISLNFAIGPVTVTSAVCNITLNVVNGGKYSFASYLSGNNTNSLKFIYISSVGDTTPSFDYVRSDALNCAIIDPSNQFPVVVSLPTPFPSNSASLSAINNISISSVVASPLCMACPGGMYTDGFRCIMCPFGYYSNSSSCFKIIFGSFDPSSNTQLSCNTTLSSLSSVIGCQIIDTSPELTVNVSKFILSSTLKFSPYFNWTYIQSFANNLNSLNFSDFSTDSVFYQSVAYNFTRPIAAIQYSFVVSSFYSGAWVINDGASPYPLTLQFVTPDFYTWRLNSNVSLTNAVVVQFNQSFTFPVIPRSSNITGRDIFISSSKISITDNLGAGRVLSINPPQGSIFYVTYIFPYSVGPATISARFSGTNSSLFVVDVLGHVDASSLFSCNTNSSSVGSTIVCKSTVSSYLAGLGVAAGLTPSIWSAAQSSSSLTFNSDGYGVMNSSTFVQSFQYPDNSLVANISPIYNNNYPRYIGNIFYFNVTFTASGYFYVSDSASSQFYLVRVSTSEVDQAEVICVSTL